VKPQSRRLSARSIADAAVQPATAIITLAAVALPAAAYILRCQLDPVSL
jgi:hypothetical protein